MVLSERGPIVPLLRGNCLKNTTRVIPVARVCGLGETGMDLGSGSKHILSS